MCPLIPPTATLLAVAACVHFKGRDAGLRLLPSAGRHRMTGLKRGTRCFSILPQAVLWAPRVSDGVILQSVAKRRLSDTWWGAFE